MPTPNEHALLSASSAARWMRCTAAPKLEAGLPDTHSSYAEEGRLAHAIAELKVRKKYVEPMGPRKFSAAMKKLASAPLYNEEMQRHTDTYLEYIDELAMSYKTAPHIAVEQRLDFSQFVPEGFGIGDCLLIGGDLLNIVDFKYGQGVPVSADHNPQMMLYAVGALLRYSIVYGGTIQRVKMSIVQPRAGGASDCTMTRDELMDWASFEVKPKAALAYSGEGASFLPGEEQCRFCRARQICRARAEQIKGEAKDAGKLPPLLTDEEVGRNLGWIKNRDIKKWISDLESYALNAILDGREIPGWKAVEGTSRRAFLDADRAIETVINAGYPKELLYDYVPKSLATIEKDVLGKVKFSELLAEQVVKPQGKPALAPVDDKRAPYRVVSAVNDFAGITQ